MQSEQASTSAAARHILSDSNMNHFFMQLKQIDKFDGDTMYLALFIKSVDNLITQYKTTSSTQNEIIQGAILNLIVGPARTILLRNSTQDWNELRTLLISEFNSSKPPHLMIMDLHKIKYQNSLRKFIDDLDKQTSKICNKLSLDNNAANTVIFSRILGDHIAEVIREKLPLRVYISICKYDISTPTKLKQAAQAVGLYDDDDIYNFSRSVENRYNIPMVSTSNTSNTNNSNNNQRDRNQNFNQNVGNNRSQNYNNRGTYNYQQRQNTFDSNRNFNSNYNNNYRYSQNPSGQNSPNYNRSVNVPQKLSDQQNRPEPMEIVENFQTQASEETQQQ